MEEEKMNQRQVGATLALRSLVIIAIGIIFLFIFEICVELLHRIFPKDNNAEDMVTLTGHVAVTLAVIFLLYAWEKRGTKREVAAAFKEQINKHFPLAINAGKIGLVAIYPTRLEAVEEIKRAIAGARTTLFFLGVAYKEKFFLDDVSNDLFSLISNHPEIDMRLMALNPITSPAVFRAFMETAPDTVQSYLNYYRTSGNTGESFEQSTLFTDCQATYKVLRHPAFIHRVRFYRRDPTVWMILTEDRVFVESYTFGHVGNGTAAGANIRLGGHMPVFEFSAQNGAPYKVLKDHFEKIWATSTDEPFHLSNQFACREVLLNEKIFKIRQPWLQMVADSLSQNHDEKRKAPRMDYPDTLMTQPETSYKLKMTSEEHGPMDVVLKDCSRTGAGIVVSDETSCPFVEGEKVILKLEKEDSSLARALGQHFFQEKSHPVSFSVIWKRDSRIGLRRDVPALH